MSLAHPHFVWKRFLLLFGALLIFIGVILLALHHSFAGCGELILGRWSVPTFLLLTLLTILGITIAASSRFLTEQSAHSFGLRLLSISFGLIAICVPLDIALRLTSPPLVYPQPFYISHDTLGYFFQPLSKHRFLLPDSRVATFRTDEYGLIVRTESNIPDPDARHIMFLGDSFLEGVQTQAYQNMSVYTINNLEAITGQDYQGFNLGVSGYSPYQYYLSYRYFADTFSPEWVVVLTYVGNDFIETNRLIEGKRILFGENELPVAIVPVIQDGMLWFDPHQASIPAEEAKAHIVPEQVWKSGVPGLFRYLVIRPACNDLQTQMVQDELSRQFAEEREQYSEDVSGQCRFCDILEDQSISASEDSVFKTAYSEDDLEIIQQTLQAFRYLDSAVQADGRKLLLVIIPVNNQMPGQGNAYKSFRGMQIGEIIDSTAPQDILNQFCEEEDLACIDLLPIFKEYSTEQLYWYNEVHLTPRGHQLVGEVIADYLAEQP